MADKDTKIVDLKTEDAKKAPPAPEPVAAHHDAPQDRSAADKVLAEVEAKDDVRAAVAALVEHAMLEMKAVAGESQETIELLADHLSEKAHAFADAVEAKVEKAAAGFDPGGAVDQEKMDADTERHYGHPHNDAAGAAVAHGMAPREANLMTTIGSNS